MKMKANEARQYIINEDGEEIDLPASERLYQMSEEESKEFMAQVRKELLERTEEELSELDDFQMLREIAEEMSKYDVNDIMERAIERYEAGEEGPYTFDTPEGPVTIELHVEEEFETEEEA
jgi:hypothetical protein